MSTVNTLSRSGHLEELNSPLVTARGVRTPAQRRSAAQANLFGGTDGGTIPITVSITAPKFLTSTSVGTVSGNTVAEEHGDNINHTTKLTLTAFAMGTVPDNASLGIGNKFYTFPAGTILVENITWVGSVLGTVSALTATPEFGIGSVIASGAVSVLSGTATFEDYMDGNTSGGTNGTTVAPDINGTTFYKNSRNDLNYIIKTSGGASHDLFLNAAAAWADVTAAGTLSATGVITVKWRLIS